MAAGDRPDRAAGMAVIGASQGYVGFRPVYVTCTPRCGRSGWRCRPSAGDPQETLTLLLSTAGELLR